MLLVERFRGVLLSLAVAAAYVVAGKLGLSLAIVHPSATAVWAPTGIALAAFLRLGYGVWPAIFIAAFLVNVTTEGSIATSIGIALGNTLEGAVGCYLVTRFARGSSTFSRPLDVFAFTGLAAFAATTVSASVGVTTLALAGYASWADYGAIWATWWLGDAAGALIFAPPILLWSAGFPLRGTRARWVEVLILVLVTVGVAGIVFSSWLPAPVQRLEFLVIPPIVWIAFRFGPREAATTALAMSTIALWATVRDVGPFAAEAPRVVLLSLQAYMSVITLMALALAAAAADRRRAEQGRLEEARDRVRTHEALEESEELHRAIAELTSDFAVIVRLEPEGGAVLESATDGFRRVTGYMAEEFDGPFEWRRLLDLDTLTDGAKMGERLLKGERVSLELRIVGKDGARRWLRCHAEPFQHSTNDRVDCILVSAEDVTDRRMADESLRRHQEVIRELSTPVLRIRDRLLPARHRSDRRPAGPAADRGALEQHQDQPGSGGGDRHDRRRDDDAAGRPADLEDDRSVPAARRDDHRYWPVPRDRRHARLHRPRSRAGDQSRRFARRDGRGRASPGRRGGAGRSRRPCAASGGSASLAGRARPPRRLI